MGSVKIILENINEGDIFPHELVRLAGHVEGCPVETLGISIRCTSESSEHVYDQWKVGTNRRFIAFLHLQSGANTIAITILDQTKQTKLCVVTYNVYYEAGTVNSQERSVKFLYIKCCNSDGCFQNIPGAPNSEELALKKLDFNAKLCQLYYSESLAAFGYKRKAFKLDRTEVFVSKYSTTQVEAFTGDTFWRFYEELMGSGHVTGSRKLVCVLGCTRYDDTNGAVRTHTAATLGDVAMIGGGCLYSWASDLTSLAPCLQDNREVKYLFNDTGGRGTYGAAYSTTFGSLLHELGHAFDMDHTPTGIMGRGFDDFRDFVLQEPSSKFHPSPPYDRGSLKWWNMWNGAMFHPISLSLLDQHSWMNILPKIINANTVPYYHIAHNINNALFGENDLKTSFSIDISSNDEIEIYYDNLVRGIRHEEKMFGYRSGNSKIVKLCGVLTEVTIRVGALVDGVSFTTQNKGEITKSAWMGGNGGCPATIYSKSGYNHVSGSICEKEKCLKSVGFASATGTESLVATCEVSSDAGIGYMSVFHRPTETFYFHRSFIAGDGDGCLPKKLALCTRPESQVYEFSSKLLIIDALHRLQTFTVPTGIADSISVEILEPPQDVSRF